MLKRHKGTCHRINTIGHKWFTGWSPHNLFISPRKKKPIFQKPSRRRARPWKGHKRCVSSHRSSRSTRLHKSAYVCIRLHSSVYVCIRQHTSAYVCIRLYTSVYISIRLHTSACVCIRQHTSTCVNTSAYVHIRLHASSYVSIRQHRENLLAFCEAMQVCGLLALLVQSANTDT